MQIPDSVSAPQIKFTSIYSTLLLIAFLMFTMLTPTVFADDAPPALVINEIMQNPSAVSDGNGEWFEIYNPTDAAVDINGWTMRDDGSNSHIIANGDPLLVPVGGYVVLGNDANSGTNGGVTVAYAYPADFFQSNRQ